MNIEYRFLKDCLNELNEIKILYENTFPKNERRPFEEITNLNYKILDFYCIYCDNVFCGFTSLLVVNSIAFITYFAIKKEYQNQNIGSNTLSFLKQKYFDKTIIADLERQNKKAINNNERIKRINFYVKNGFMESKVKYTWQKEKYVILSTQNFTKKDFRNFWKNFDKYLKQNKKE